MIRYFALSILCLFGLSPLFATDQTKVKEPQDQSAEAVKQQKESPTKNRRQKKIPINRFVEKMTVDANKR